MKKTIIFVSFLFLVFYISCAIPIVIRERGPHLLPKNQRTKICANGYCRGHYWPIKYHVYKFGIGYGCENGGICFEKIQ